MEYVLNVLVVLKFLEEFFEGCTLLGSNLLEVGGDALKLRRDNLEAVLLKIFLNVGILLKRAVEHYLLVAGLVIDDVFEFVNTG